MTTRSSQPPRAGMSPRNRRPTAGPRADRKRIAVLVETSTIWGAGIVEGIGQFVRESAVDWDLWLEPRGRSEQSLLPKSWRPDGVIARVTHPPLAQEIVRGGIPAVDVSWYRLSPAIPRCSVEEREAAEVSARYLADRGLRRFAYVGSLVRRGYQDRFQAAFAAWVESRGFPLVSFDPAAWPDRPGSGPDDGLTQWLATLVTPTGLLTFDSFTARRAVEGCLTLGLDVPERVAVLAGEHDELVSRLVTPAISSLDHSACQVGRRAARLLADLLSGRPRRNLSVELPTGGVVTRQSTDMLAIDDQIVAGAVRFIRQHAHEGIGVGEVIANVRVSRRLLEQRFRQFFDRSPAAEIRRVKVERARKLLANGNDSLEAVATACGFSYAEVMTRVFRRETGMTPSDYRRRFRA